MKALAALAGLVASACAAVPPDVEPVPPEHGSTGKTCKAAPAQKLIGRTASGELGTEALGLSGAGALRWIPHDGAYTMDYRADRLNIHLDRSNKAVRIDCG